MKLLLILCLCLAQAKFGTPEAIKAVNDARKNQAANFRKHDIVPLRTHDPEAMPSNVEDYWRSAQRNRVRIVENAKRSLAQTEATRTAARRGIINARHGGDATQINGVWYFRDKAAKDLFLKYADSQVEAAKKRVQNPELPLPSFESHRPPELGQAGELGSFTILSVEEDRLAIRLHTTDKYVVLIIDGIDTTGLVDGRSMEISGVYMATDTRKYGGRTVMVMEPISSAQVENWRKAFSTVKH